MAITDENTVLVLGAGVSAPFGLGLGAGMIESISKKLNREFEIVNPTKRSTTVNWNALEGATRKLNEFDKLPILGTIASGYRKSHGTGLYQAELESELGRARTLALLLEGQTSETIDDFIVQNPSTADIAKLGIAAAFLQWIYVNKEPAAWKTGRLANRYYAAGNNLNNPKGERNWIHLLINVIRQGIKSGSVTVDNKIIITTFNYDKILEHVLEEQFSNTECKYEPYSKYVKIIHAHGQCGDIVPKINEPWKTCSDWASGIHVVNEEETGIPERVKRDREEARKMVSTASHLYFCGFSFASPNCQLLNIANPAPRMGVREISFCNYDGNLGVSEAAKKNCRFNVTVGGSDEFRDAILMEAKGTIDRPLSVSDWIKLGCLGDLPG